MGNKILNKKIPSSSGVYFFFTKDGSASSGKGALGKMLYIGKAANLKNRLGSYRKAADPRIKKMLATANDLNWQETGSEIEALILESRLIKKYHPLYNIRLRDDKQYFYVGFTKEEFPRVFLTHQPTKSGQSAIHLPENSRGDSSRAKAPTKKLLLTAKSQGSRVARMADLSKADFVGPFTEGVSLKTALKLLRKIFPFCTCRQKHHRFCLNYHLDNCPGFCCLKNPKFTQEQKNNYQTNVRAVLDILKGKKVAVLKKLEKEINSLAKQDDFKKAIELRNKIIQLKQVFANAKVIKKLAGKEKTLTKMQKILNLPSFPQRIEGYDISNIQGEFATGSMAVFINGQPDKNQYRKFKIRSVGQADDTAMLKEVLTRRFNHPEWPLPDLILVDGGKGQFNMAKTIVPREIAVIALTKDKQHHGHHIFSMTKKNGLTLLALKDLPSTIGHLILHIDSEAHRFAISYYRQLHRKSHTKPV